MRMTIRAAVPADLTLVGERLAGALFNEPPRAWCWIAEEADHILGYALATTLFSTWDARDTLDLYRLHVVEPARRTEIVDALVARARRHVIEYGLAGVRWIQGPAEPAPSFVAGADRRDKLRFTLSTHRDMSRSTEVTRSADVLGSTDAHRLPERRSLDFQE